MPHISIVTISFNQLKFLPRCIQSIRSQDFSDYEHIVVDAGSTDGSRQWLEAHPNKRTKLVFKADSGPAEGLNNGLARCGGDVFLYINADDELPPHALKRISELHRQNPTVDVIVGNGWTIDSEDRPLRQIVSDRFTPLRYAASVGTVLQQATSFKRRVMENGVVFNTANRVNWDTEFLFDSLKSGHIFMNVDDCLGYFRLQADSITVSGRHNQQLADTRRQLVTQHAGTTSLLLGMVASPFARLLKRYRSIRSRTIQRPVFPGLSRISEGS